MPDRRRLYIAELPNTDLALCRAVIMQLLKIVWNLPRRAPRQRRTRRELGEAGPNPLVHDPHWWGSTASELINHELQGAQTVRLDAHFTAPPFPYFPDGLVECRLRVQVQALPAEYLQGRKSESCDADPPAKQQPQLWAP